jgi:hypothetical protein
MRNLIMAGLMATSLLPAAAQAQWIDRGERAELNRDRRDIYEERRDLERAYRYGDRRDVRDQREDYRDARREYREDWHDARRDWGHDNWHRRYYAHDNWGRGYGYQVPRAGWGQRWVRQHSDLLLIDSRNGRVYRVIRNYYR